jgi:hypothetical protein
MALTQSQIDTEIDAKFPSGTGAILASDTRQVLHDINAAAFSGTANAPVSSGATSGSPFSVPTTARQVLVNKATGSATFMTFPTASTMAGGDVLIKDVKGDADTNIITIQFSGGELCDGVSTVTIGNKYGWVTVSPVPGGGAWYRS